MHAIQQLLKQFLNKEIFKVQCHNMLYEGNLSEKMYVTNIPYIKIISV
jgi:hypothetical protein